MKKLTLIFTFFCMSAILFGQSILTRNSLPGNHCTGMAKLNTHLKYYYGNWTKDTAIIAGNVDSISGICPGAYKFTGLGYDSVMHTYAFVINIDTATPPPSGPCQGINAVMVMILNADTLNRPLVSCNGNLFAIVAGGTPPYTYAWSNYFNTPNISNLCVGEYKVLVQDTKGCQATAIYGFRFDSIAPPAPLQVYVNTTDASSQNVCNGSLNVSAVGGKAPYSYLINPGNKVSPSLDSLCPNAYTITVTDANGKHNTQQVVIAYKGAVYGDSTRHKSLNDSVIVATVKTPAVSNCSINYSAIDSALIQNFALLGQDSIEVTWNIYSKNTTMIALTNHYPVGANGVYNLVLQLFCDLLPAKTNGAVVNVMRAVDKIYVNKSILGIPSIDLTTTKSLVFPNPFSEELTLSFASAEDHTVTVFDVLGNKVAETFVAGVTAKSMATNAFAPGVYMIRIATKYDAEYIKVIKHN